MPKTVNAALKAEAWSFEAKAKAIGHMAKALKFGLEDDITAFTLIYPSFLSLRGGTCPFTYQC